MTKLSKRIPDPSMGCELYDVAIWHWLKELAETVEFVDRRDRLAYRDLRERISKTPQKVEAEYEPQTYDEAIALIKGWQRYPETGLARWESPSGDRVVFDFGKCSASWERHKWPDLWKEMSAENCSGHLYHFKDMWVFYFSFGDYRDSTNEDSTPGRVVCQAYLVYKGHADWAERLSKEDEC